MKLEVNMAQVEPLDKYRKRKLGSIPSDWEKKELREIVTLISGQHINASDYSEEPIGIPYLTGPTDFQNERIVPTKYTIKPKACCKQNDILITVKGSGTGKTVISDGEYCISRQLMAIRTKKELTKYIYYHLKKSELNYNAESSGLIPGITREDILSSIIPVPSSEVESMKIGEILSTWDKAIELKKNLIEQKKEQKKGLMQRLLTGEVRLPGFKGEWKEVRLGEVLKERKETGHVHLELLAITAQRGIVRRDEVDIKDNSSEDKSKYKRIMPLDIGYNTMRMWQGVSGVSKYEGIVSPAYTVLKPTDKVDSYFMGYLFKLPKVIDKFRRYSQGLVDDTLNLKYENFKVIKVRIPQDVNEQKAIAQILICVDKEIEFLEKELEALKQQKKGLMQLLLTGKIRVKC